MTNTSFFWKTIDLFAQLLHLSEVMFKQQFFRGFIVMQGLQLWSLNFLIEQLVIRLLAYFLVEIPKKDDRFAIKSHSTDFIFCRII